MLCSQTNQIALHADWLTLISSLDRAGIKFYRVSQKVKANFIFPAAMDGSTD